MLFNSFRHGGITLVPSQELHFCHNSTIYNPPLNIIFLEFLKDFIIHFNYK